LFLTLCPALPWPCELRTAAAAVGTTWWAAASITVLCCWVLVPAWLLALRHEVAIGHVQDAVLIGLGGLVWLLAAANCYQRAAQAKSAVSRTTVTAAQLEDVLPGGITALAPSSEQFFAPQPSTCLPVLEEDKGQHAPTKKSHVSNTSSRPAEGSSPGASNAAGADHQAQKAKAASSGGAMSSSRYSSIIAEIQMLQRAVYGNSGVRPGTGWPVDVMVQDLAKLCKIVGLAWKSASTGGKPPPPEQLHSLVEELKRSLGV